MVNPIPNGCNTVNIYLFVPDGHEAIEFYKEAFGVEGGMCMPFPDGTGVMHADLRLGNSTIMLSQENEQWGTKSPKTLGGSPASLHVYVDNVDEFFKKAIDAGCTQIAPVGDMFWGDRMGKLEDPYGFQWGIAQQIEVVPEEEMNSAHKNGSNRWPKRVSKKASILVGNH